MTGCDCVWLDEDIIDTTECAIHPLTCEALHPETGHGCHHDPGHPGQHAYVELYSWPNEFAANG